MKTTNLTRAAALIAALALAAPAFGQTIDIDGSAGAGASGSAGGNASGSVNANVDANVGAGSDTDADTATSSDSADADTDSDTGLTGTVGAVIDPLTVRTDADLETYAEATVSSDERVQDVNVTEDEVSIEYDERAHLFGVFPILVTATATVDSEGKVSVRYPWYRFLMSTQQEALEASANAEVRAALSGDASATLDAQAKARALAALHRAMKAQFDADVSASADAEAEASN